MRVGGAGAAVGVPAGDLTAALAACRGGFAGGPGAAWEGRDGKVERRSKVLRLTV